MAMTATDQPGAVVPRGRELLCAVSAGLLWLLGLRVLVLVPSVVASAHDESNLENRGLWEAQVFFLLVGSCGLLLLAGWFSLRGHGRWAVAPRVVRTVRALTWSTYLALGIGAFVVLTVYDGACFRSCASFPH